MQSKPGFINSSRKLLWLLAAFCMIGAAGARAGTAGTAANITAGVKETILPNGLKVITKEVRSAPVVSFAVWYRVGSRNEHTGITGVSHLLEHMLFKGTRKYQVGEISRTLFVNGASFNASTYYDWTNYYETLAADRLELAMQIEADRMVNSKIDEAELKREMTVVRSELEGNENNPGTLLFQAVTSAAFDRHPYQWPVIGWRSDVENVPHAAIYNYYKTHYGPNNATVVIVGDFETEKALALVRKHFGGLKRIPEPTPVYTVEPPQRGERRVEVRRAGTLPMAAVAFRAPSGSSSDSYAMDVISNILSSGRSSRLYQNLIEKQVASSADAYFPSLRDGFLFMLTATANPGGKADNLEKALIAEVEKLKAEPVSAEELARAKSQIEASFVFDNESVTSQANQLGYWEMTDSWKYLTTYLERIRALTPADLQKAARKYFTEDARTVGHFIPTAPGAVTPPPPAGASARVDRPRKGDRPIPLPKPVRSTSGVQATRFKLDNGISVVVQENHTNPTFALRGNLPAGSVHDPENKNGVAALTAAMLTRGTEKYNALEFASGLERVGASLNARAGSLHTSINGQAQSKDFDLLMDRLAEMLRRPTFPEADLQRLKGLTLAGMEQEKDDPASLANRAFARAVYPAGNPLRPETLDDAMRQVSGITRTDLESFYRNQYGPNGLTVVVVGDVKVDQVRRALQSRLGDWARNPNAKPIPALEIPLQTKAVREVIPVPDKSETAILFGHAGGVKRSDPDFYAVQVMNMILGGGGALNSRLGNTIRDEQGLAYDVYSFFDTDLYAGPFQVGLGTNPANAERAVQSLQAELQRIREQGVTQREVDEAVAYLTGRFPLRLETNAGLAEVLLMAETYNLGPDYIRKYGDLYRAVTLAQVNEAARKHLSPDRATLILAGTVAGAPAK